MKINGYDVDSFLQGSFSEENDDKNISYRLPSREARHIKSKKKVKEALAEIDENSAYNLYLDIKSRWLDDMNKPMTYYRDSMKTAKEVFSEADKMAMAFDEMGLKYGDQIVACMSNVPEVLVLLLAASKCGLIVNFMSDKFSKDYIRKIFRQTPERKLFIATDDRYSKISDIVDEVGFSDKVVVSLMDSLNGKDPYDKVDSKVCKFVDRLPIIKKRDKFVMSYTELLDISNKWNGDDNGFARREFYPSSNAVNAPLTITYVPGKDGLKQIVHSNRSYITMSRFSDSDLSRIRKINDVVSLSFVPTHFNTNLSTGIINVLSQGGSVAFEPLYHPQFLLYSMAINKPTCVYANRSVLIEMAKRMNNNPSLAEYAFSNAIVVAAVDELPTKSEEEFINKALKDAKAGSDVLPKIVGSTALSVNGGSLEYGNIFFTMMKEKYEKIVPSATLRTDFGLIPFQAVNFAVLDEGGVECDYEEYGRLVLRSKVSMLGYLTSKDNRKIKLMDNEGRVWDDSGKWGAILKNGNVIIKGNYDDVVELANGEKVPYFMIADKLSELEEVLSCEVVKPDDCEDVVVAHIELMPDELKVCPEWIEILLGEVEKKCQKSFSPEIVEKVVYKIRPAEKPFPLTADGKRDIKSLQREGITDSYKPDSSCYEVEMITTSDYLSERGKVLKKQN